MSGQFQTALRSVHIVPLQFNPNLPCERFLMEKKNAFQSVCKLKEIKRGNRFLAVNALLCSQELPHCKMFSQRPLPRKKPPEGGFEDPVLFTLQTTTGSTELISSALYQNQQRPKCWLSYSLKVFAFFFSVFFFKSSYKCQFIMNRSTKLNMQRLSERQ